jgi:lipopolysaccharide biosynthesis glycosyltransferase
MRLTGYDRVVFADSDILFQSPISELFKHKADLVCCPDSAALLGHVRDRVTFKEHPSLLKADGMLNRTFNAGLMVFDGACCGDEGFSSLAFQLDPNSWGRIQTGHTDQVLFNLEFECRTKIVSPSFNYQLGMAGLWAQHAGVKSWNAHVLHFNGRYKPWHTHLPRDLSTTNPELYFFIGVWREAFIQLGIGPMIQRGLGCADINSLARH